MQTRTYPRHHGTALDAMHREVESAWKRPENTE